MMQRLGAGYKPRPLICLQRHTRMNAPNPQQAALLFRKGIEQFNCGEYFESHESWELIWLPAPEPDKTFLQGIIQIAAALHHYHRGNLSGARSLLRRGLAKIEPFPADYRGVRVEELRARARAWQGFLHEPAGPPPQLPRIRFHLK